MGWAARASKSEHKPPQAPLVYEISNGKDPKRKFKLVGLTGIFSPVFGLGFSAEQWLVEMLRRRGFAPSQKQLRPDRASPQKWLKGKQQ